MEVSAQLKEAIEEILDEIQLMFKEQPSGESEIKKLVEKIKDEIKKSDVKVLVILKKQLGNVLAGMEDLETEHSSNASRISCFFGGNSSRHRLKDTEKPKVRDALERVANKAKYLNGERKELVGEFEKISTSLVGREKEKEEIVDQLMLLSRSGDGASPVPVISIAGLAGIGKTKLARHVCEDEKVQQQVGLPAWVSGTKHNNTFKAGSIAKEVIESVVTATTPSPTTTTEILNIIVVLDDWSVEIEDKDLNALQEKVKEDWRAVIERINPKVLQEKLKEDPRVDIGDTDEKALQDKLKEVRLSVTAIIITTRSCLVARKILASPVKSYALPGLSEEESLSLFQTTTMIKSSSVSNITEDVRRKIVGQCRGVPQAVIIMATLHSDGLREDFLAELWCWYYEKGLPNLFCFAYCSMFPQDYLIDAERLIHLWMAEGFLRCPPSTTDSEEVGGRGYLRDLVLRSIFQDVKEDEFGEVRSCRMHPLMHDIARFILNYALDINADPSADKDRRKVLRASFDLSLDFSRGTPATLFEKAKEMGSMFFFSKTESRVPLQGEMSGPMLENIFKISFKRLCVLDLRDLRIVAVASSIGELNNLEYLDLSLNDMEKLPNSIHKLSKLQTLKLSRCYSLKELPKSFEKLAKLEHLDMEGCLGLTHMPCNMSKLSSLQMLSAFVASKNDPMGGLGELTGLASLRGSLEILHLERVQPLDVESKQIKCLEGKEYIQRLTLRWNIDLGVDKEKGNCQLALLDSLKPHSSLGALILVGYQGPSLSTWLTFSSSNIQFKCLVKLSLQDCHGCIYLSQQDQLPKLKILELLRFDNLEYVIAQNCDKGAAFYLSLKELIISDCPKLKSWWQTEREVNERPVFASISKLHVQHCPILTCMPLYPRLDEGSTSFGQELFLEGSSLQLLLDTITCGDGKQGFSKNFIPLENLHILNCNHLEKLSNGFQHLSSLQRLRIENCAEINLDGPSNQWEGLKSLRFLTIREIPTLRSLSFGNSVTTLRELTLQNCHGLTSMSDSICKLTSLRELTLQNCLGLTSISDSIGKLTSLRRLVISKCNKLQSLPKAMKDLESLKTLIILDCALLLPRCQPETGDDWPQIRHIKDFQVK